MSIEAFQPTAFQGSSTVDGFQIGQGIGPVLGTGDFFDYIFQFPDQGSFQRDPVIQNFAPPLNGTQPGVQLLVFNPVESLQLPTPSTPGNALVLAPQLANSTVPLPGFWALITIQSSFAISELMTHPNLQILNDRTLMFASKPSVVSSKIDISHINIIINIFGVYVQDGMKMIPSVPPGFVLIDFGMPILEQ